MAVEEYNKLSTAGKLNFVDFDVSSLPAATKKYVVMFVLAYGYELKVHSPPIDNVYLFAIDHPIVRFLMHDSVSCSHMWGNKHFENMDNNLAVAMLSEKRTGLGIERACEVLDRFDRLFGDVDEETEEA